MSVSKTFSATAIGIALREKILNLDDKVADILKEFIKNSNDNLKGVTIEDLLKMGAGESHEVPVNREWQYNFFNETEFKYKPGIHFLYDNASATLLALIIYKITGLSMVEYLKERLFDKIGINHKNVHWFNVFEGVNFAPGGFFCTSRDLLKLMILYLNNGIYNNERILDENFVKKATSKQIDSSNIFNYAKRTDFSDNIFGYGYMMWMSHDNLGYRAEGAYGQFGIVVEKLNMIIVITQSSKETPVSQTTLNYVWEFVSSIGNRKNHDDKYELLKSKINSLKIKDNPVGEYKFNNINKTYRVIDGIIRPYVLFYDPIMIR